MARSTVVTPPRSTSWPCSRPDGLLPFRNRPGPPPPYGHEVPYWSILTAVLHLFLRAFQWYAIKYYYEEAIMSAITATEARKSLFGLIQQVNDDHTVVEVVSRHGNAVILSKDDYDAITETAYLLRNPANAERLLTAIERVRRGEFEQHDLTTE